MRSRKLMLLAVTAMFSAVTISWAIDVAYFLVETPYVLDIPLIMSARLVQKWNILGSLQNCVCRLEVCLLGVRLYPIKRSLADKCVEFVFSDAIVIWRAWILYSENRPVKIILSICLAMSLCE